MRLFTVPVVLGCPLISVNCRGYHIRMANYSPFTGSDGAGALLGHGGKMGLTEPTGFSPMIT